MRQAYELALYFIQTQPEPDEAQDDQDTQNAQNPQNTGDAGDAEDTKQAPTHPHESILMAENLSQKLSDGKALWPQEAPHELAEKYWKNFLPI